MSDHRDNRRRGVRPRRRRSRSGERPKRAPRRSPGVGQPEVADSLGDTLEEAIERGLQVLGAREDEVEIEIVEEGRRPFLGFLGAGRPYRIRVSWQEDTTAEVVEEESDEPPPRQRRRSSTRSQSTRRQRTGRSSETTPREVSAAGGVEAEARDLTQALLDRMGMEASVRSRASADELRIEIESERDDALLIGRRGETRAALQHIVQRSVARRHGVEMPVLVDVNGYWARRADRLAEEAQRLAEEAVQGGVEVESEALSAQERRIIHRALADDPRVRTESVGEGLVKRVSVIPERDAR